MRSQIATGIFWSASVALLLIAMHGTTEASSKKTRPAPETVQQSVEKTTNSLQLVTFPNTDWTAVKVVRGSAPAKGANRQKTADEKSETAEIVTFGGPGNVIVRVIRGDTDHATPAPEKPRQLVGMKMELVSFSDPRDRPVSILRGSVSRLPDIELFGPASAADLDRVAFAVDGAESRHGADLRMWRVEPNGPQGPMQVTAAAAIDVGGGDRFDVAENRLLGRAYLARMYRRYGNWPDAIAAYNWGPGNVDSWINAGRAADKLPLEVERYRDRVLRDTAGAEPGAALLSGGWLSPAVGFGPAAERPPATEPEG
jgi:hypothetical protein